jgi:hypothetical protein
MKKFGSLQELIKSNTIISIIATFSQYGEVLNTSETVTM